MPKFFTKLERRKKYSAKTTKRGESFYSFEYYREHYQHEIAEDCQYRCVYCDTHESEAGGRESMELDHFRPWSLPQFAALKNVPSNFHHACSRCNRLKGANWPSTHATEPHDGAVGFIDPFLEDRRQYFRVESDGSLTCLKPPAAYLTKLLQLDRPLLRALRVRRLLRAEVRALIAKLLPEFEAAERGDGSMTREQIAAAARKLCEYHQLLDLCDAPLERLHR